MYRSPLYCGSTYGMSGDTSRSQWTVTNEEAGLRLDKYLAAPGRLGSRGRASTALAKGKVFLDGKEALSDAGSRTLSAGQRVLVWHDRPGSAKVRLGAHKAHGLDILFEDAALIVINKPAGVLTVPLPHRPEAVSVQEQIESHLRSRGKRRPHVVHRIDRDTSGLVVFAKDARSEARLKDQFRQRTAERVYQAIVYGHPSPESGTWRDRMVWDDDALIQKQTHPRDPSGKDAICHYRVLRKFQETSLIEVRLVTGKRNQIRLQARLRGHTLVGEQRYTYGPRELRPVPFSRQALHAWRLKFTHPVDDRPLEFEAQLPQDLRELLEVLGANSFGN